MTTTRMTLGERLKSLRTAKKWSLEYVGNKIGKTKQMVRNYEVGPNPPPLEVLSNMASLFGVTTASLLNEGDHSGKIIIDEIEPSQDLSIIMKVQADKKHLYVPYFDIDVTAGKIERYFDVLEYPTGYIYAPEFSDCIACKVYGDSMYDRILPGATVFVRKMNSLKYIDYGQIHVVVTEDLRVLKYVLKHDDPKYIILSSENLDKKRYSDFPVEKEDVLHLLLVKGYTNQTTN